MVLSTDITDSTVIGRAVLTAADAATARAAISATILSVDGTPVGSYNLDTTSPTASDLGAYTTTQTDDAIVAGVLTPVINSVKDAAGNTTLEFLANASAVVHVAIANAATGGAPALVAAGSDTNIPLTLSPKGTGAVVIYASPSVQTPTLRASGSGTGDRNLNLVTKGTTGVVQANGVEVVTVSGTQTQTNKTLTSPKISSGNAPASATSTGTAGRIEWDANYVYICVATNTWKRAALSAW